MTARSSIDPAEFLHEHLAQASPDLLRQLMEGFVNTLLSADADSVCGAAYGTREEGRINRRNRYRRRDRRRPSIGIHCLSSRGVAVVMAWRCSGT